MSKFIDPDKMKIGYVVLVATCKFSVEKLQYKAGYGESSKWTHVAGCLGGLDAIVPRSRVIDLQKEYIGKGYKIKVMWRRNQEAGKRYKVALQFFWFPLSIICGKIGIVLHDLFSSRKRFLCSELIVAGFYKEGDYLFGKPAENILPADFDNLALFEEIKDIWLSAPSPPLEDFAG